MATIELLERARQAFERQAWADAYERLSKADGRGALEPLDLERMASAAYLTGRHADSAEIWARAHQAYLKRDEVEHAARCALRLGIQLMQGGERARGGGWIARARRLIDEGHDCVEQGYLLIPVALGRIGQGDSAGALEAFRKAAEVGERFRDRDLEVLARHGQGRALIRMGEIADGVALLDEAMIAVESGEISAAFAGDIYCSVIEACREIFDLRRAQEWTTGLSRWCESQPDLVRYRGQCMTRRAEIMQLHGEWPDAMDEAQRAAERLTQPPGEPAAGAAFYQQAELHRLRGEYEPAEEAYLNASKWGRKPQPGLALLRLAQERLDAAQAAIRREADEARSRAARSNVLPALVEIMLAEDDVSAGRTAADELLAIAGEVDAAFLHAVAASAHGAVLLAEGNPRAALDALRRAWNMWLALEAPYEVARVRVLLGRACRALGDEDTACMEFEAARSSFQDLGAAPDLARVDALTRSRDDANLPAPDDEAGLTPRELEVLRVVAAGRTNKEIADELFISQRTVERHVSNIFNKLGVSSRTAAAAYAFEHGLI